MKLLYKSVLEAIKCFCKLSKPSSRLTAFNEMYPQIEAEYKEYGGIVQTPVDHKVFMYTLPFHLQEFEKQFPNPPYLEQFRIHCVVFLGIFITE